ncbi:MAG: choice-of-anchor Q domain-containing protein, partial [Myxococcota bacterium]
EDWVVENNVVIVNHWHGITFLGARNVRIVNNTLLDNGRGERPGPPWIQVAAHKDGTPSEGIVIRNNLAETITLEGEGVMDHNLRFDDPRALFVDPASFDLHLLEGAAAIDMGTDDDAPTHDRDGIPRPQGEGIDLGAYEWHDGTVMPEDAGVDAGVDAGIPDAGSGRADSGPRVGRDGGLPDAGPRDSDGGSEPDRMVASGGCAVAGTPSLSAALLLLLGLRRRR